jgi:hypothetical protein
MGRGRAKAKQQKVARELKYSGHFTDLDALQRELGSSSTPSSDAVTSGSDTADADETDDEYGDYQDYADDEDWAAHK